MLIQEKIAVAAIVLAAAVYLVRLTVAKYRKRRSENACAGCGCEKDLQPVIPHGVPYRRDVGRNGSGKEAD